jgi:plastocyanin
MKTMRGLFQLIMVGICLVFFGHARSGFAATFIVNNGANISGDGGDVFVPATNTINLNDQVIWVWIGNHHSTTSGTVIGTGTGATNMPDGLWDSGEANKPHSFTNTFTALGSFPYYCQAHFTKGQIGLINVIAPSASLTILITNPPDGTTLSAPASFTLAAATSDSGGNVTNVEFFQAATSLGDITNIPYSVSVNNLAAADYTFSAVATDDGELSATNSITVHVVTPNPIVISGPVFLSPSDFQFNYSANVGLSYVVQQSSDLINWISISTNVATGSPMLFDDPNATGDPGFYRVGLLPNP